MDVFSEKNYKSLVKKWIKDQPNRGRGEFKRISEYLRVSSVLISQIFKGDKDLSLEQAHKLTEYLGHTELERKYFLALVALERAGTADLRSYYKKEIRQLIAQSQDLSKRVKHTTGLSRDQQCLFYSDWIYSGLRLATEIGHDSKEKLAKAFSLDPEKVSEGVAFCFPQDLSLKSRASLCLVPHQLI